MPFRPIPVFRRNLGVIMPLTAAIGRLYERRADGAYPLGAFYTENISRDVWIHLGGIWYEPVAPERVRARRIAEERIKRFMACIVSETQPQLDNGTNVSWELVSENLGQELLLAQRAKQAT